MVRIRMQRFGRTHRPFFRIAAMESREPRNGKVLENLGWYNPIENDADKQISLKEDRIKDWLSRGAMPSDTVRDLLGSRDLLTDRLKAEWEADRARSRDRVECRTHVKTAEDALASINTLLESTDADVDTQLAEIKSARVAAMKAASRVNTAAAAAAGEQAAAALAAATKADEAKKAAEASAEPEAEGDSSGDDA